MLLWEKFILLKEDIYFNGIGILLNQQNKEKIRIKQLDKIKINYKEKEDYEKQIN